MDMKLQDYVQLNTDAMASVAGTASGLKTDHSSELSTDSMLTEAVNKQCVQLGMRLKKTMGDIVDNFKKPDPLNDGESEES